MKRFIALAAIAIGAAFAVPATAQSPCWNKEVVGDGSFNYRSGLVLPRTATRIKVRHDVRRAGSGKFNVAVLVTYCDRRGICNLPIR